MNPSSIASELPRYRREATYAENFASAPTRLPGLSIPEVRAVEFLGFKLNSPLGISAGPLLNGRWLLYYSRLGFDFLTYKTVRSAARECHPLPNLVPVVLPDNLILGRHAGPVSINEQPTFDTWTVSFGMPSQSPDFWRQDIADSKQHLQPGQILNVSVVGTEESNGSLELLAADYAQCAKWAVESGADCIEMNFSCPNVCSTDGQLYQHPEEAAFVASKVRATIRGVPLLVKIGYLSNNELAKQLLIHLAGIVDAVVTTNSISSHVQDRSGTHLFDGQLRGICGAATFPESLNQVERLQSIIQKGKLPLELVGCGGIDSADRVQSYLSAGASLVQLASAPMLNPMVGIEIRQNLRQVQVPAVIDPSAAIRPELPEWPVLTPAIREAVEQSLHDGSWGQYHAIHTEKLTQQISDLFQTDHTFLTCSGTAAVEIALRGAGVEQGDEVIMSAYDYKPNFTSILHLNALPVLVDIRPDNGQLNVDLVREAFSERTKAILASHLHGAMVDMPALHQLASERGIPVIEDSSQMAGAHFLHSVPGQLSDISVISFGGTKTLTAGRGGAIFTHREDLAQRLKRILNRGNEPYPLTQMQAALLLPQMKSLTESRQERTNGVHTIREGIEGLPGLHVWQSHTQTVPDYYKLGFNFDADEYGLSREIFIHALRSEGIPMDFGFRTLHLTHARKRFRSAGELPNAEHADECVVTLHHPILREGAEDVVNALRKIHSCREQILAHAQVQPELMS